MERERWRYLYQQLKACRRLARRDDVTHSDIVIVAVFLWAVVNDRSVLWACQERSWPRRLRRFELPDQSTMSRRLRTPSVVALFDAVADRLREHDPFDPVQVIDAKPIPVSNVSRDPNATIGRAGNGFARGYKLFAIWREHACMPSVWHVDAMNTSEKTVAKQLVPQLPHGQGVGRLIGDNEYDFNELYDLAGARGWQLIAPRRPSAKHLGHHRHSPWRLRCVDLLEQQGRHELLDPRAHIERTFGNLAGFGGGLTGLPPWVRRPWRVRLWVYGKLLVNAVRILNNRTAERACA